MMRSRRTLIAAAALLSSQLIACGAHIPPGTLSGTTVPTPTSPRHPQVTISVAPVRDARPAVEHEGEKMGTKLFVFYLFGFYHEKRGNYVTDDFIATSRATEEMRAVAMAALTTDGVATQVVSDGPADFELELEVEHLYATHYDVSEVSVVVLPGKHSSAADVAVAGRRYAPYGNAVLKATLIDHRGGINAVVWSEYISGFGERPASENRLIGCQNALRKAVGEALQNLAQRVGGALDRLGVGPSGQPMDLAAGSPFPTTFVIERMARYRDFLERGHIDTSTGRVIAHEILPAPDRYASRPGDWVLAKTTAEGVTLSPDGYERFARAIAAKYDLRRVDDATHYHFFGVRRSAPQTSGPAAIVIEQAR